MTVLINGTTGITTPGLTNEGSQTMVSLAFKAIQEQQAIITALTARVTALEGN